MVLSVTQNAHDALAKDFGFKQPDVFKDANIELQRVGHLACRAASPCARLATARFTLATLRRPAAGNQA